jgi:hypothetical protein
MRVVFLAALAALAFTSSSFAAPGATGNGWKHVPAAAAAAKAGPYKRDSVGKCHAGNGALAKDSLCLARPTHCRDPKTKAFTSCKTPGAVPA